MHCLFSWNIAEKNLFYIYFLTQNAILDVTLPKSCYFGDKCGTLRLAESVSGKIISGPNLGDLFGNL